MSKGSDTRNRIIAKAAPLFNRKGFEGCSMQDIVEVVGLEKGSIYGHFPTKEALAVAAFEYAWNQTATARLARMDAVPNAIEKLRVHVSNVVSLRSFPGGCPLVNAVTDNDDGNPALRKAARDAMKGWQAYLEDVVRKGQERQEIRPEVVPEEAAGLIISLFEGAGALDRLDKKSELLDKAGKYLNLYLDTIGYRSA